MPQYKVTKVFVVDAPDKHAALAKLKNEQDALNHLEYVSIKDLSEQSDDGWAKSIKAQLTGSKK